MKREHMILGAFFFNPQGDHRMAWRHPAAPGAEIFNLDYFRQLAALAEAGCFDALFVADHVAMWDTYESNVAHYPNARLEPLTLLSALSAVTRDIGLIGTVSASYSEPYNTARMFASLDHLSHGRAAWNVVTSGMNEEAMNFGRDANLEHAYRYARAAEYLEVVEALWDSWEDGAVQLDRHSGSFADPARVHRIDHHGAHFKVRGPLNVPRTPQGHPVIVQAGSSEDGRNLAARFADLHFTRCRSIEEGRAYREDFDARLARYGRTRDAFKILPGVQPIVASSAAHAQEKRAYLETLVPERVGVDLVSSWCGVDLAGLPIDGPLPELPDEAHYDGQRTNLQKMREFKAQNKTIREIARLLSNVGGAHVMAGTATDIADQMEAWFRAGICDGFNLMFPVLPGDCEDFVRDVVPELQRRGLAQTAYRAGTLRDKLGLAYPANRFSADSHV
ncbi:MAG TPA: LLM class flavin-dependent oxidoreductase [Paraburkholderia sp.]|jgi:FMN-dependent oxidoreductase (nitrilotriacetate monooxygenase family)|nr:LLM class flavin-dependent oxidoreductase [Paraburkholderia sp.]